MIIPEAGSGYLRAWHHSQCPKKMSCHTIASQILVASWHSFESSEQRGDLHVFCFILIKEIQLWQNRFRDLYLNVSQQRGKTLFLKAFQAEPALRGWLFSHQNRIALVGLE
ncbi:unnamed protein product [Pipistrellus nathusii]|uniref:Uncharacterized protein n=1 Tax=Pipistrellus nathusii TaxID=59473 RepID=A0ABN9Z959_PIPNA